MQISNEKNMHKMKADPSNYLTNLSIGKNWE